MRARGDAYIREHLSVPDPSAGAGAVREAVWIAIHLRVGGDWRQVCKGYKQNGEDVAPAVGKKLHYASPQCLRGKYKNHLITPDLCLVRGGRRQRVGVTAWCTLGGAPDRVSPMRGHTCARVDVSCSRAWRPWYGKSVKQWSV